MKNLLLLISSTLMLSSTALAGNGGTVYLKALGGVSKLQETDIKDQYNQRIATIKSKSANYSEFGAGYNITDNTRVDFTAAHYFNPEYNTSATGYSLEKSLGYYESSYDPAYNYYYTKYNNVRKDIKFKMKFDIDTLMLNGYVDFFTTGPVKFFVGGGFGVAHIRYSYDITTTTTGSYYDDANGTTTYSGKDKVTDAIYSLTLGTSMQVHQNVIIEASYSYKSFGKISNSKDKQRYRKKSNSSFENHLNSNNFAAGVRINL